MSTKKTHSNFGSVLDKSKELTLNTGSSTFIPCVLYPDNKQSERYLEVTSKISKKCETLKDHRDGLRKSEEFKAFFNNLDNDNLSLDINIKSNEKTTYNHKKNQTKFRESSTQTKPYEPKYIVKSGNPEILNYTFLKWGTTLPCKAETVELIKKAKYEKHSFIESNDDEAVTKFINCIETLAWIRREKYIDDINKIRMELFQVVINEFHANLVRNDEEKLNTVIHRKLREKENDLLKIRNEFRVKERLQRKQKFKKASIFTENTDYTSELYLPVLRHGVNPKYRHEVIVRSNYKPQFYNVENYSTFPKNCLYKDRLELNKTSGRTLCIRQTKWTDLYLKNMYLQFKYFRKVKQQNSVNLRFKRPRDPSAIDFNDFTVKEEHDQKYLLTVLIQKVLRGRATQKKIFQGCDKCRGIIDELRICAQKNSSLSDEKWVSKVETKRIIMFKIINTYLDKLSSGIIGPFLDLLSKEMVRLLEERSIHALVMVQERDKLKREAEESGQRQKEIRRRKEHDEIFRQVLKIKQETVDLYLQEIIDESVNDSAQNEAMNLVDKLSQKTVRNNRLTNVENITDLYHNFMLPFANKNLIRKNRKNMESRNLRVAHNEIYGLIEDLGESRRQKRIANFIKEIEMQVNIKNEAEIEKDLQLLLHELKESEKIQVYQSLKRCMPSFNSVNVVTGIENIYKETFSNTSNVEYIE